MAFEATRPLSQSIEMYLKYKYGEDKVHYEQTRTWGDEETVVTKYMTIDPETDGELEVPNSGCDDPRVKSLDKRALRRSGGDELPQLAIVAAGLVMLCGLRPWNAEHKEHYRKLAGSNQRKVGLVDRRIDAENWCPGLVSPANLTNHLYDDCNDPAIIMETVAKDVKYAYNGSVWTDLALVTRMPVVLGAATLGFRKRPPQASVTEAVSVDRQPQFAYNIEH